MTPTSVSLGWEHWVSGAISFLIPFAILWVVKIFVSRSHKGVKTPRLDEMNKCLATFEEQVVDSLTNGSQSGFNQIERIRYLLDYAVGRHDWYEEQRFRVFQMSIAIVALVVPLIALASGLIENETRFLAYPYLFGTICSIVVTAF